MMPAAVKLFEWEAMRKRWRGDGDGHPRLLQSRQLKFKPVADVADRGSKPIIHEAKCPSCVHQVTTAPHGTSESKTGTTLLGCAGLRV
jgi:hypothetical protein